MKPLVILVGPNQPFAIDEIADFDDEQFFKMANELEYRHLYPAGFPYWKPERWERVYRRWGFKHRDRCIVCNAPKETHYATCLTDACVIAHMERLQYQCYDTRYQPFFNEGDN